MVTPAVGSIVMVPFPFSDLSQTKMRPEKLFTSNSSLMVKQVGSLKGDILKSLIEAVIGIFRLGLKS